MKSFKKFSEDVDKPEGQPQSKIEVARQRFAAIRDKAKELRKNKNTSGKSGEAKFNTQKAKFGTMHKNEEEK
tara:strand:- start:757 stop:972 length:216 start_codon:yes stop_codon:yes gene_type:complete